MDRLKLGAIGAAMSCAVLPMLAPVAASAQDSANYFRARAQAAALPQVLSNEDRSYYRSVFAAIDDRNWSRVDSLLAQRADGPLHQVARAEYFLHADSPRVELPQIEAWLASGTHLPQTQQIIGLGEKRGLAYAPSLPPQQGFARQPSATKRIRPRTIRDGTMPDGTRSAILDRIKNDDPDGARLLLDGIDSLLSSDARAEWRQRIAWSYYIENDDPAALAMASTVREGTGAWVAEGDWVMGLAAWRLNDCEQAASGFQRAARGAVNPELAAAAHYWAARAYVRCRYPENAAEELRGAAAMHETLYGMLAREQLGQELPDEASTPDFTTADWQRLQGSANVRTAVALSQVGQEAVADQVLRHEARIGPAQNYDALGRLARELGMPATQLWMAHNAPYGAQTEPALRFPVARWEPVNGWKVDPALAYAHTLQESNFRPAVVSPAGARGLMQIMPAAAQDHAGRLGVSGSASSLSRPEVNLAFGQRHLEMLRDHSSTQGKLPKIMAAYNAGLTPITRWNGEVRDQDDPLLYMESIPYWETRGYVAIVMRNYWMYERQAGASSETREALAQGRWPGFPGTQARRMMSAN
ncbi:hypothetical protein HME9302_01296 [Alteripontixanthobacter maritimus]|uniref:Transglycosylase SLT domain-containing protein n=2 Tax=Alteripontixanthobacter maritimus TaxID=2161824 RepID=A0A369QA24_9SPHN|nr:hypothetical protein HME9302_01296 [Alteripontixanthobacter maritimus]